MQFLTALSLKNRALIALVTIVAAVFGTLSMSSLKQELMPSVQFPTVAVMTTYPGASPDVVNNDVSTPIETALRAVPNLETTTATSSTGSSVVLAQFTYGVDLASTEQKVERAVSRLSRVLPDSADSQVMSGSIDDFPVVQISATPASNMDAEEAADLLQRVAVPAIKDLPGIRDAQLLGSLGDRISIVPNDTELANRGLTRDNLTAALQQSGILMAAGTVNDEDRTLAVQLGTEVDSVEQVGAIAIPLPASAMLPQVPVETDGVFGDSGDESETAEPEPEPIATPATIADVADVTLEKNPVSSISRVNGEPAITIAVTKTSAANTVDVSKSVQAELDTLTDKLNGIELKVVFDQAPYIQDAVHTLTTEGLLGLIFAVIVILLFLVSVRATLVTAISIPVSVLLTFVGLNFADYTLNMLTLGALTISIGRVVDDSIVVIENIKRHLKTEENRAATIVHAVREVAGAITASTLTTVAVFLPMAFVAGMVGEMFRPFAFTVTFALIASLLVSLTIVPVLAYWFVRPADEEAAKLAEKPRRYTEDSVSTKMQSWYRPIIEWTLLKPGVTIIIAVAVFIGTMAMTPLMKTNFMGSDEQNSIGLTQTLEPGTSLDAQLDQAQRVEDALVDMADVETVQVTIGGSGGMSAMFGGSSDGVVTYSITTNPDANQEKVQNRIRAAVDDLSDAGEFAIAQSGGGMTMSSAIEIYVTGPDQETIEQAAEAVTAELQTQKGIKQVESDLAQSRPYLKVAVDRTSAAKVGLTESAVAAMVVNQMQPQQIGQVTIDSTAVSVYLTDRDTPNDKAAVEALMIQTPQGERTLASLATVEVADGPVSIRTEDTERMVTVSALPDGDDLGSAGTAVNNALKSVKLPAGASAEIGGVMSQQSEAFGQLGIALLAAILIVYVVMVATFRSLLQPLLLLISVPFAATGAVLLLLVTGTPLGVASLIGVLMLVGIVVTNAIVLIDLVNQYRDQGEPLRDAVIHGSLQRLRPIVMTALATILALLPMGLGISGGGGGFISKPLAVVVIGGLLTSTVLTLVVLPTLYYLVERRRENGRGGRGPVVDGGGSAPIGGESFGRRRRTGFTQVAGAEGAVAGVGTGAGLITAGTGLEAPSYASAAAEVRGAGGASAAVGEAMKRGASLFRRRAADRPPVSPADLELTADELNALAGDPGVKLPDPETNPDPISVASSEVAESADRPFDLAAAAAVAAEALEDEARVAERDAMPEVAEDLEPEVPFPTEVRSSLIDVDAQQALLKNLVQAGLNAPASDVAAAEKAEAVEAVENVEPVEPIESVEPVEIEADEEPATVTSALRSLGLNVTSEPATGGIERIAIHTSEIEVVPPFAETEVIDADVANDIAEDELLVEPEPVPEQIEAAGWELVEPDPAEDEGAAADLNAATTSDPLPGHRKPSVEDVPASAIPITGEINWEELMWQAAQEVDGDSERETESDNDSETESGRA
ncbi:efflux RND transporter permease subunit [Leucobacter sp. cx-328]|uniref:efflux RND transporter permease subunit n=1 Tax=unclassified Leucobacter TaxID=2621730 RepID=UPI00165E30F1|nr:MULTISPECIES: efflux RND transporter permease subunit [unclassified Leucobacter]MBC9943817.1 efflux RND transporter permease subunit [Leucobacter sp. cx-328]